MDTIIHPETGETINLFSQEGLDTLNKFVNTYKKGGNIDDKINNLTNIYNNLQSQFTNIKNYFLQSGGAKRKRNYSTFSSESDESESNIRNTFIDSLPDDIKEEIKGDEWSGSSSGIHRKDGKINLVETDKNFYKFIPEGKAREIDKIYETLATIWGFTDLFYQPIIKLPTIGTETIVVVEENGLFLTYYVYKVEKWGESLEKIKNKGEIEIVGSGIFGQVMDWLEETLKKLHSKTFIFDGEEKRLTHGDILNDDGVNWGNILAKQKSDYIWEFKLIDFGNEMSSPEKEKEIYDEFFVTKTKYIMLKDKISRVENRRREQKEERQRRREQNAKEYDTPIRSLFSVSESDE